MGPARGAPGRTMLATRHWKRKVCLVGEGAVGKTSLIRRFVVDKYDDRYIATLGTKVTKKAVELGPPETVQPMRVELMIWDVMGQPRFRELLQDAYFEGAAGILAVADITRQETFDALAEWLDRVERVTAGVPVILAVNKADLRADPRLGDVSRLGRAYGADFLLTSAKTGANVDAVFRRVASRIVNRGTGTRS